MPTLKIYLMGGLSKPTITDNLFFCLISEIGYDIEFVNKKNDSDLILIYPYICRSFEYKYKYFFLKLLKLLPIRIINDEFLFLCGINYSNIDKVLFISFENLDRDYWWQRVGKYVIESSVKRMTSWPVEIDKNGVRFPYWYNYINWKMINKVNSSRYGRLIDLDKLLTPLVKHTDREAKTVSVISHIDYPRNNLLNNLSNSIFYGGVNGSKRVDEKQVVLSKYHFNFCPENSVGFGYVTEKVFECWDAGCVPIYYFNNPFSEINPAICELSPINFDIVYDEPLLLKKPDLTAIKNIVSGICDV